MEKKVVAITQELRLALINYLTKLPMEQVESFVSALRQAPMADIIEKATPSGEQSQS